MVKQHFQISDKALRSIVNQPILYDSFFQLQMLTKNVLIEHQNIGGRVIISNGEDQSNSRYLRKGSLEACCGHIHDMQLHDPIAASTKQAAKVKSIMLVSGVAAEAQAQAYSRKLTSPSIQKSKC